jgi:sulfur relay (sulfurtransferase) DsrF/TusC family protein
MKPKTFLYIFLAMCLSILWSGCDTNLTGPVKENKPPNTHTIVDTIIRSGENRLNSEVLIKWWGDDPDGYIQGYELKFDNGNWFYTTRTDSIFILSPPPGQDTMDFTFYARAIDNNGLVDPTPARLVYPVKNSPPTVKFVPGLANPVNTFPVLRFYWEGDDPDGLINLNRYEITLNDTTQNIETLGVLASSITLQADNPGALVSDCSVYLNNNSQPESFTLKNLLLNDTNRVYIRVIDNSEATSKWVSTYAFYVKKVSSDILMVNAYTSGVAGIEKFYRDGIRNQGIAVYDSMRIFETSSGLLTQQAPDNITQSRIFDLFKVIVWYGSDAAKTLSLAQKTTSSFFDKSGKMFMAVYVSSNFDEQSQFLDFTPAEGLISPKDTTLILNSNALVSSKLAGWPVLKSTGIVGVVKPMQVAVGSQVVYDADLLARDDNSGNIISWTGPASVIALRNIGGQTNFIFSTLELENLNGNNNIDSLFRKILIDEFGL